MTMSTLFLAAGKEKLPRNHHTWVYSGAIESVEGAMPTAGDIVKVADAKGAFSAYGHCNPDSKLAVRLLDWHENAKIDHLWFKTAVQTAVAHRSRIIDSATTDICRLIHGDADGLPGLIVDRFGTVAVLASSTPGMDLNKKIIAEILMEVAGVETVYEKSDGDGRTMEGLTAVTGLLCGKPIEGTITAKENGCNFLIDIEGQKTGYYADQRENRSRFARYAAGGTVLELCSFSASFSVNAFARGATSTTLCDVSAPALTLAKRNLELNGVHAEQVETICGSAFDVSRTLLAAGRCFNAVVCDPPKLMPSRRDHDRAAQAYKDLNLQAIKLTTPGGYLATFSCSGALSMDGFREIVAYAAKDAGRTIDVVEHLHAAADHPVRVSVPETEYLKGLILRVGE